MENIDILVQLQIVKPLTILKLSYDSNEKLSLRLTQNSYLSHD